MADFVEVRGLAWAMSRVDKNRWSAALHAGLTEVGQVIIARGQADRGDEAPERLSGSFAFHVEGHGLAQELVVTARGPGARAVEFGRRPGSPFPPTGAIEGWLSERGGDPADAFVVARSIARRGTKGKHFFRHAVYRDTSRSQIARGLAGAVLRATRA